MFVFNGAVNILQLQISRALKIVAIAESSLPLVFRASIVAFALAILAVLLFSTRDYGVPYTGFGSISPPPEESLQEVSDA